jgi:hypothetical protein
MLQRAIQGSVASGVTDDACRCYPLLMVALGDCAAVEMAARAESGRIGAEPLGGSINR